MIGKTIEGVIGDSTTPFYIHMTDGSVYHLYSTTDPYEKYWSRIELEEVEDLSIIDISHQHDLGIISDDEYGRMSERLVLKENEDHKNKLERIEKFKELRKEMEKTFEPEARALLMEHKNSFL